MSNFIGYSLTGIIVATLISCLISLSYLRKNGKRGEIIKWIMLVLPTLYLFLLSDDWMFGTKFLPSQDSDDLTYSLFHIGAMLVMVVSAVLMVFKAKKDAKSDMRYFKGRLSAVDNTILQFGIMIVGIEIYKQLVFLNLQEGIDHYSWYGFPLQFCSIPILLYPVSPLIRNKVIKSALYSFMGIFTFVAGLTVMVMGGSVFTLNVSISVHTMIWHGTMVVVGLYLMVSQKIGIKWSQYASAIAVLIGFIILVQGVNILFHHLGIDDFDGFFINPWKSTQNMPILSDIRISLQERNLPVWAVGVLFSAIYTLAFSLGGFIVFAFARIPYLLKKPHEKTILPATAA